jgi:hypothetical protein
MIHLNLTSDTQTWEFKHPHFKRGEVDDLQNIKRKSTKQQLPLPATMAPQLPLDNQNDDYNSVQKHILHLEDRLQSVSRSYDALRNEAFALKAVQLRQQEVMDTQLRAISFFTDLILFWVCLPFFFFFLLI